MQILQKASSILNKKSTYFFLLSMTVLISVFLFIMNRNAISGDHFTYLYYVKGFEKGWYTYWYDFSYYVPDTFRNPGYPFFLYGLHLLNDSLFFIQGVQWLLLLATLRMMLGIIEHYENSLVLKNLFLLLVCFNFIVLSYPALIYPETLVLFLITLIIFVEVKVRDSWKKTLLLALIYGYCFQVRPVILFIPFLRFMYFLVYREKTTLLRNLAFISLFILTLLPYGCWNLKHHGQFKITPLEGGGGVLYLGYWSPKMIGHLEDRYWRNIMFEDIFINFAEKKDVPGNIARFNNEWDSIERLCAPYRTGQDSINDRVMRQEEYTNLFPTYSAGYTTAREKILKTLAVRHYLEDWSYTLKLKTYTFFRIWYSGYNIKEKFRVTPLSDVASMLAFITTFSTLLAAVGYLVFAFFKRRSLLLAIALPLFFCLYFGALHTPFAIQSRYTIPVRLLLLFSLAYMMYKIHFNERTEKSDQ